MRMQILFHMRESSIHTPRDEHDAKRSPISSPTLGMVLLLVKGGNSLRIRTPGNFTILGIS